MGGEACGNFINGAGHCRFAFVKAGKGRMRGDGQFKGIKGITAGQVVTVILRDEKGVSLVRARPFGLEKIIQHLVTD